MSIVSEPSFESGHFRHGIDERPVPFPPFVQHAGRTTSWSTRRQIRWHVHYPMAEHRTGHQRKSRRQRTGRPRLVVLRTRRYPCILLFYRGWCRRWRLLILWSGRERQWADRWASRWTGRRWRRLKNNCARYNTITWKIIWLVTIFNAWSCRFFELIQYNLSIEK